MANVRSYCTYFDRNYLVKGLSLIRSLIRWHGDGVKIYVVCMDELTRILLNKLNLSQVVTVPLHAIEEGDAELLNCRHDRTHVEYLWTSTPTIILRILENFPEIETVTYVDADMYCYGQCDAIYQEFGDASVMIHEHRFPQHLEHLAKYGRFNVGLLVFRRDERAFTVLRWWREKCIEWCKATMEDDRFGDQKYLDVWPTQFEGVKITQNIGVGTAPWNHSQYKFSKKDGSYFVNDTQLLIYHFHCFNILNLSVIVPVGNTDYHNPLSYFKTSLLPYLDELTASAAALKSVHEDFMFGLVKNEFELTEKFGFLIETRALPYFKDSGLPAGQLAVNNTWTLFPGTTAIKSG